MEHYDWNDGWLFAPTFDPAIVRPECTGVELEPVRLPHTVKTLPYNYCNENDHQRLCGYRREFFAPAEWAGRTVLLTFGAIAHDATVFCNGRRVFHHGCGYTAFTVDLTESLLLGQKNVVAVRCDSREDLNIPPFGGQIDFLTYGGIYRAVSLDVKEPAYLRDIFIEAQAEGDFRIYSSTVGETIGCTLQAEIRSPAGSRALYSGELSLPIVGTLNGVHPWSVEHPFLYTLTVRLIRPGTSGLPDRVLDEKSTRFGFRTIQFVAGGFYLNGQRVELRGLNRHQSYAYQGYAMPDSIQQLDAQLLKKQLGCNAVRTSHYPQSPAFLDACDELGLLVFVEMPGWQHIGDGAWKDRACAMLREMLLQNRNHPSIILWGVRINESVDDDAFYTRTNQIAHQLDPSRATSGVRYLEKSHLLEDVYAYNDFSHNGVTPGAKPKKDVTPDMGKALLISECNGHMYPTKPFDDGPHRQEHALRHVRVQNAAYASGEHAGCFGWCMFDYQTHKDFGSGDRICYHGVLDSFRNPKLAAAVYASQGDADPVLAVSSSMDIGDNPAGQLGTAYVFSNAQQVKLYKNDVFVTALRQSEWTALPHPPFVMDDPIGELLETQEHFSPAKAAAVRDCLLAAGKYGLAGLPLAYKVKFGWCMLHYKMSFEDGVALYGKYVGNWGGEATRWRFDAVQDGNVVRSVTLCPSAKLHLEVKVSRTALREKDTYDMAAVRVRILDENGTPAPYAQFPVQFAVEGSAALVGPQTAVAEGGMTGTYLRTVGTAGEALLTVSAPQTQPVVLRFTIEKEDAVWN